MNQVHIGLIGAGFLAQTRLRNYTRTRGAAVVAVAASSPESATAFASGSRDAGLVTNDELQAMESVEALLAREDIDVVDLCVPNPIHRPLTERAAAAGKHVICTKPLVGFPGANADDPGDPTPDAQAMVDACTAANVHLMYAENWIYAPSIRKAAALHAASNGVLLEMRGWEAHSGSHAEYAKSWATAGGGALLRLGSHPIGAMLQLKEEEGLRLHGKPTKVSAVTATTADLTRTTGLTEANTRIATGWLDVENWGMAVLHFEDGSRGIVYGSDNCLGGMQSRLELNSSNAQYQCNLSPNDLLRSYAHDATTFDQEYLMEKVDTHAGWNTPIPDEDWSSGQLGMCQAFVADLQSDRKPLADGSLGVEVMRVLAAAYQSARSGNIMEIYRR
ncbi:MAG: Gfo/Idh/MocA family oxidoreductase [Planctomycetes bacterium]|nr:Gfo/Idh/MocA family oxidoreductase [Planctomycetota bacterium]